MIVAVDAAMGATLEELAAAEVTHSAHAMSNTGQPHPRTMKCMNRPLRDYAHHTPAGMLGEHHAAAVWTVVHRGYSGNRATDVWAYPTPEIALQAAAELALSCGLDEDAEAVEHHKKGNPAGVIARYLQKSPDWHILAVAETPLMEDPNTFVDWLSL